MTIPVERWREEIFDVIDNCDARCISWNEQFRRVDKVLARFAAEVREAALQEAAEMCVSSRYAIGNARERAVGPVSIPLRRRDYQSEDAATSPSQTCRSATTRRRRQSHENQPHRRVHLDRRHRVSWSGLECKAKPRPTSGTAVVLPLAGFAGGHPRRDGGGACERDVGANRITVAEWKALHASKGRRKLVKAKLATKRKRKPTPFVERW